MKQHKRLWRWVCAMVVLLTLVAGTGSTATQAQSTSVVYYPQTGHFLRGTFRAFFDTRGGVPLFGYPITDEYIRDEDGVVVQYFERARFELVAGGVRLGDIGVDYVELKEYEFEPVPPVSDTATRRYFPETGHYIQGAFKAFWDRNNGADFFGSPISQEVAAVSPQGETRVSQYFERARIEMLPSGAMILGLLGRELAPCQQQVPRPRGLPPSGPGLEGDPRSCNNPSTIAMGRVYPEAALPGSVFAFEAINFKPGEEVLLWLNRPDGSVRNLDYGAIVAENGYVLIGFVSEPDDALGSWSLVAQGEESRRKVLAPFRIVR